MLTPEQIDKIAAPYAYAPGIRASIAMLAWATERLTKYTPGTPDHLASLAWYENRFSTLCDYLSIVEVNTILAFIYEEIGNARS